MRTKAKGVVKAVAIGIALLQWIIFLPGTTIARNGSSVSDSSARYAGSFSADVSRILWVLETRIEDERLLERTMDKLWTLDHKQIRLIASLSDRVAEEGNRPGSDIAFLLMTALIALM
jgi:hypothetical protein